MRDPEFVIKNFIPLLIEIVKTKKYPARTPDGRYFVLTFKPYGRGVGKGGRNYIVGELVSLKRLFFLYATKNPEIVEKYGIKIKSEKKVKKVFIKREFVENYPYIYTK